VLDADFGSDEVPRAMIFVTPVQRMVHLCALRDGCLVAFANRLWPKMKMVRFLQSCLDKTL